PTPFEAGGFPADEREPESQDLRKFVREPRFRSVEDRRVLVSHRRDERSHEDLRVAPRTDERTRRGRAKQVRRLQIPPLLEPVADPAQIRTNGEATALDVPAADPTCDLPADLGERRPNPVLRPRRSGGRGTGHGQAAGVGATGFGGAGAGGGFSSTTSSQRS